MTMDSPAVQVATTATQAWDMLCKRGLEIPGRDDDLVELLCYALRASQGQDQDSTLDKMLQSISLEEFIRAFFQSATPYVDMLKDILRWFEQADAKKGPHGWKLAWDGGDIQELKHFRESLRKLEKCTAMVELPAISFDNCWKLIEHLGKAPSAQRARRLVFDENYQSLPKSAQNFAYFYKYAFDISQISPLGASCDSWLIDVWNIIRCATLQLNQIGISGQLKARENAQKLNYARTKEDGLAVDSLCTNETDYWLLQLIACASAIVDSHAEQTLICNEMEAFFDSMERRSFVTEVSVESFTTFLDLPLWERRHEFFSAWIATRIIDACGEHEQELLHEKGVITLPFRCTEVARVLTANPVRTLFSERRSPLSNPKGKGRSQNVQPDFSIWHSTPAGDLCDLVVEVKHYLRPAKTNWVHVIEDYADAHPMATIVLLNYGKPGNAMSAVRSDVKSRCQLIGNLRPGQPSAIAVLSDLVKRAVGPVFRTAHKGVRCASDTPMAVILDRSFSMKLAFEARREILTRQVEVFGASHVGVATIDANVIWQAKDCGVHAVADSQGNSETRFTEVISNFLDSFSEVIFITDDEGNSNLDREELCVREVMPAQEGVRVLQIALRQVKNEPS
ncbi:hypothetical protein [Alcaligenes sp. SJTW-7]|uniref:hypothetical protein n=1 Tax=Alcaligenes sp. SJTW-7 TaxID=3078429 RepID=UPI0039E793FE